MNYLTVRAKKSNKVTREKLTYPISTLAREADMMRLFRHTTGWATRGKGKTRTREGGVK